MQRIQNIYSFVIEKLIPQISKSILQIEGFCLTVPYKSWSGKGKKYLVG